MYPFSIFENESKSNSSVCIKNLKLHYFYYFPTSTFFSGLIKKCFDDLDKLSNIFKTPQIILPQS